GTASDLDLAWVSDLPAVLALQILSRVYIAIGDLVQASTTIAQARELAFEGRDRWAAECNSTLAAIHSLHGEWGDAEARYLQALQDHERVGNVPGIAETLLGLGVLHERRMEWTETGDYFRRAVEETNGMDPGPARVAALRHTGVH